MSKLVAGDLPMVIASWRFRIETGFLWVQPASHCNAQGTGSVEFVLTRPAEPSGRITLEVSSESENPMRTADAGISWRVGVNDAFSTAPFTSMRYPTVLRAGASHSQSRWIDDVVLFAP